MVAMTRALRWFRFPLPRVFRLLRMQIIVAVLNVVTSVILARALGPELRGQYAILALWISVTANLALFGSHLYLARRAGSPGAEVITVYSEAARTVAFMIAPTILLFAAIAWFLTHHSGNAIPVLAWVVAGTSLPFSVWNAMQMQIELGRGRTAVYSAALILSAATQFLTIMTLWLAGRTSMIEYFASIVAGSILASLLCQIMIARSLAGSATRRPESVWSILKASRFDAFSIVLMMAVNTVDRLVVSFAFPAYAFGLYVVALSVAQLQNMVTETMAPLFFGNAAAASRDQGRQIETLQARLRQSVLVNLLTAITLVAIGPTLLPVIFGEEYRAGASILYLLLPAFAFKAAMRPFEEFLKGRNMAVRQSMAHLVTLLVFLLGALVALQNGSVLLAATSLLAATMAGFVVLANLAADQLETHVINLVVPRLSDLRYLSSRVMQIFDMRRA